MVVEIADSPDQAQRFALVHETDTVTAHRPGVSCGMPYLRSVGADSTSPGYPTRNRPVSLKRYREPRYRSDQY